MSLPIFIYKSWLRGSFLQFQDFAGPAALSLQQSSGSSETDKRGVLEISAVVVTVLKQ